MIVTQYQFLSVVVTMTFAIELPETCKPGQYHDPGLMACEECPANATMMPSPDGFGCICEDNSIRISPVKCKRCNTTEVLSSDGMSCVPRRCQKDATGRMACRKCPSDYVSVTQNLDGSPMREVQCVKCSRGYKPLDNRCVRCESCTCPKNHIVVRDQCIPKQYLAKRSKYEEALLHPNALLDVVKHEYLCTTGDGRHCRLVANECVRNFYTTDHGGPCRLWLQSSNVLRPPGLPQLILDMLDKDGRKPGDVQISPNEETLSFVYAVHNTDGSLKFMRSSVTQLYPCFLPKAVIIGRDFSQDCHMNISDLEKSDNSSTLMPYLNVNNNLQPVPVSIRKPSGSIVQRGEWSSSSFRRFFIADTSLSSTVANVTNTVYLRKLLVLIRIKRDKSRPGHLSVSISLEAQYVSKSAVTKIATVTFEVKNDLPSAGILRGLEIWGGVLGALLALYAIIQWRGVLRRGGLQISILPIMSGCVADALYFTALFSTLHAVAAEAGTLGLPLPLSSNEKHMISTFIYAALSLKIIRVSWINWKQCSCDFFCLDWSEYNPPQKETQEFEKNNTNWKISMVVKEWRSMQTKRRANPAFTITIALILLHFMEPWWSNLPQSHSYKWVVGSIGWWSAYTIVLVTRWLTDRTVGSPSAGLAKVCSAVGVSLIVFEEDLYAHYVHGRSDDDSSDARSLAGYLTSCRVVCAPQLRMVYKQLYSTSGPGTLGDSDARRSLLSRFLAAFFERALDGMSWVACERSHLERLLDVETTAREGVSTSVLLYDPGDSTPSCFTMTWWCQEWSLMTLDTLIFGCIVVSGGDFLLASLATLTVWQVTKCIREFFSDRNLRAVVMNNKFL